jgi:hypothetical protein
MKSIRTILICCSLLPVIDLSAQGLATFQLTHFKTESRNGNVDLSWQTTAETHLRQFEIEYSRDGKYYHNLGFIPARNHPGGDFYDFEHSVSYSDSAFYRIKIVDETGGWIYTDPVLYYVNKISAFLIYPSVINNSAMNIYLQEPFYSLEVVDLNGAVMLKQNLDGRTGQISVPVSPLLSSGVYIVQLKNDYKTITQKVIVQQ